MVAMGQLVTVQNKAAIPTAAPNAGESPTNTEIVAPKVAPIKMVGTKLEKATELLKSF